MEKIDPVIGEYARALRSGNKATIIDFDKTVEINFDFQIHRINDMVTQFKGFMPPNRMSHYILAIINSGTGQKSIGSFTFSIKENVVMKIPKRFIHSSSFWSLDTTGFMLTFTDEFFNRIGFPVSALKLNELFFNKIKPYSEISDDLSKKVNSIFESIIDEREKNEAFLSEIICTKVIELLFYFQRIFEVVPDDLKSVNNLFSNFYRLLEENYTTHHDAKFYAAKMGLHPNYLNAIIREYTGISLKHNIKNRLIIEAKNLLCSTELSVKEISYFLGYEDSNYFSRSFKSNELMSPLAYRSKFLC